MEALKSSLRPEVVAQQQGHEVPREETTAWVVENGGLFGDCFAVDELLDLGEFGNDEEDVKEVANAEMKKMETENNNSKNATASSLPSSYYSALAFEAPPPLPPLSEISLLPHDAEELEWVSFIIDDSISEFPTGAVAPFQSIPQVQTQSDDSAHMETPHHHHVTAAASGGASCPWSIVNALSAEAPVPAKAKRSKRSRTVTVSWSSLPFTDSSSSSTTTATSSASCSSASSYSRSSCLIYDYSAAANDQSLLLYERHPFLPLSPLPNSKKQKMQKKRGRKPKHPSVFPDAGAADHSGGEHRCSHCGVKKTPQWRAGPLGAKTLCNACGVRFKSGRLLPEYRPACSPTFQNAIHSNSHRKVLEMRRKKEELLATAGPPPIATC